MLVEILSQSYRCVLPITPWVYFLLDDEDSARFSFAMLLLVAYVAFKVCIHLKGGVTYIHTYTKIYIAPKLEKESEALWCCGRASDLKVSHRCVRLSPNSITWYCPNGGDARWLGR